VDWREGFCSCGECDMDRLGFIIFYPPFFNHYCGGPTKVCSFCDAIPGSLSVANTTVSSENVAVVDYVVVGRPVA
jgi:hypothetical protein